MENKRNIVPMHNVANEIFQPVRLHYNILKPSEFFKIIDNLNCIDSIGEIRRWYYCGEILQTKYKIERPTGNHEFWIIGKIKITNKEMQFTINSIERTELALTFVDKRFSRKILYLKSMDIYNKLSEHNQENLKFYEPLENFFDNKPIKKHLSESAENLLNRLQHAKNVKESQKILFQFYEMTKHKQQPEYKNFIPTFYDDGIEFFRTTLILHQRLAYEHFIGNTNLTMQELIEKLNKSIPY
jgi:hypothetical protein